MMPARLSGDLRTWHEFSINFLGQKQQKDVILRHNHIYSKRRGNEEEGIDCAVKIRRIFCLTSSPSFSIFFFVT